MPVWKRCGHACLGWCGRIQEPGIDPRQKSMLAAEYEQMIGAVFALGEELDLESN